MAIKTVGGAGAHTLGGEAEKLGLVQLGEDKAFRETQLNVPLVPTERLLRTERQAIHHSAWWKDER